MKDSYDIAVVHGDGIGREEARWVSLCCNPALRAARLELVEAEVGVEHARFWDDPSFDLDLLSAVESAARPWLLAGP